MTAKRTHWVKYSASIIDQALLSGLNFLIGLALIRFATKDTYGLYSQLFGVGLLITTLLDALIGSALTTLSARLAAGERVLFVARAARIQWGASAVMALLTGVGVGVACAVLELSAKPVLLGLSFAVFAFALGCREYCRTALFIESRPEAVAKLDLVFVLVSVVGALSFLLLDQIEVHQIFFLLALSNGSAALFESAFLWRNAGAQSTWHNYIADARQLWGLSRWAVMGSVVGWLGNNSYLYFAGAMVGVAALADLNAARLLLIPVIVVTMAWARVARPAMGQMIASGENAKLHRFLWKSTLSIEVFAVAYVAILFLAFPWLIAHVFGAKYSGISSLMLMWGAYFAISCARNVGTVLLVTYGAFRALFWQGVLSLVILLSTALWLMPMWGEKGALVAMIIVELWELLVNYVVMLPRARRQQLNVKLG